MFQKRKIFILKLFICWRLREVKMGTYNFHRDESLCLDDEQQETLNEEPFFFLKQVNHRYFIYSFYKLQKSTNIQEDFRTRSVAAFTHKVKKRNQK